MTTEFDLFIDESGNFSENPITRDRQSFDNQLVGILAEAGKLNEDNAEQILKHCYQKANYSILPQTVHGKELQPGNSYDKLIDSLVSQISQLHLQPVRLTNEERINYGNPSSNYVNMLAELALRIYHQESTTREGKIKINFYCASVLISGKKFIRNDEYRRSLKTYLAFAAVRLGWTKEVFNWKIGKLETLDARRQRRLQICDLLSNASHNKFDKCGDRVTRRLKRAFEPYNQTLIVHPFFEKLDLLNEQSSYGAAIQAIAEKAIEAANDEATLTNLYARLDGSIDILAGLPIKNRDIHLNILMVWVEQIVSLERSLELGDTVISWLQKNLSLPLKNKLGEQQKSLSWFEYSLHSWQLRVCNHRGNLDAAKAEVEAMEKLIPNLAPQWEQVSLMMNGLISRAVHYSDCWEYYEASKSMLSVFKYYHNISSLFVDALPEIFPEKIYSQIEAKALGTWLQNEIRASVFLPHRIALARDISDVCIFKFANPQDKKRQYQYRAQLETVAGEYCTARKFLAMSLEAENNTHQAIAESIMALEDVALGFALLHWLRLGTSAYLGNKQDEWSNFESVLQSSRLLNTSWCQGNEFKRYEYYPTIGILRRVALINVVWKRPNSAIGRLRNLKNLDAQKNLNAQKNIVFDAVQIATYAEVAALQCQTNWSKAQLLLNCSNKERLGLRQLVELLAAKSKDTFPKIWNLTQLWSQSIEEILQGQISDTETRKKLLKIAESVNY